MWWVCGVLMLWVGFVGKVSGYQRPDLPPILEFVNGTIVTPSTWPSRRMEMWELLQETFYGTFPPEDQVPTISSSKKLNSSLLRGVSDDWWEVEYEYGGKSTTVVFEVLLPTACTSSRPCPLFLTQTNHRRWALIGSARGYISLVYPGSDNNCDDPHCSKVDPTRGFQEMFPSATFQLIARRAYLGSRVLDWALSGVLPVRHGAPSGGAQVGVTGHSRNSKQSLIFAASDARITSVVDSSSGVPATSTYRFSSGPSFSETPSSSWPGPWWLPSVRNLTGREDTTPIDSHALFGLIAPRPALIAVAWTDSCDPTFSVERTYKAAMKAYEWLNAGDKLRLQGRPGDHHGWEDIHNYFDWYDSSFAYGGWEDSRIPIPTGEWPRDAWLLHNFSWAEWNSSQPLPHAMPSHNASTEARVRWGLGEEPLSLAAWSPGGVYDSYPYIDVMMEHDNLGDGTKHPVSRVNANFGEYLKGNVYFPSDWKSSDGPLPGVVWLHPASYVKGYMEAYRHAPWAAVAAFAGQTPAVVLAFDQIGFGMRQHDGRDFYKRFPTWSRLGRAVADVQSALDLLTSTNSTFHPAGKVDQLPKFPDIDLNKITVVGYDIGAYVGLHAAALDDRIARVVSIAGFEPLRNGTAAARSGGNQRIFDWHALQPRLGWFEGKEEEIPYDVDDLLALICPRPTLILAPRQDRFHGFENVSTLVKQAQQSCSSITFQTPDVVSEFTTDLIDPAIAFLQQK